MMRDKVFSLLQRAWSSTTSSVDLDKAASSITEYIEYKITDITDSLNEVHDFELRVFKVALKETLPELKLLLDIHSNNVNKKSQLELLIKSIEEQIDNE